MAAIASHLGKTNVNDDDIRGFLKTAVRDAIEDAMVEYEAAMNDSSTRVVP